jgi:thiosulfate dehydrogenase
MRKFLGGVIVGIIVVPFAFYLYMRFGPVPVATSEPPMPLERFFAMTALHARLERDMPKSVPLPADEANLQAGANVYMHHCAGCHGPLGGPGSPMAKAMFPPPPQLLHANQMVTDDPPGETFWKVKNGIRLSGMPSFHAALSDEQIWQVSLMLANADKLSPAVKGELVFKPFPAPPPATKPTKK